MSSSAGQDRLVVGIDFGTTYSGVACVYTGTPEAADDISVIKMWPGANGITSDKVPSVLTYGSDNAIAPPKWGFESSPSKDRLSHLKLMLDPALQLPSYVSRDDLVSQLEAVGKSAQEAVADYLTQVYNHAKETLIKRYGKHFLDTTAMEVILTVPAVWSDAAKDATLKAAEKAGMGANLRLISEPEAAAVYTLKAIQPNLLRTGDHFVVCDAGGGTVDLISYRIASIEPLRLEESVEGAGALCGAAFLNLAFEKHVRGKLGRGKFRSLRTTKPRCWPAAIKFFEENVKRTFNPSHQGEIAIPFPGAADDVAAGISDGFLILDASDVASLFEPVIAEIIALIEKQINTLQRNGKSVNGIVLVGGFGQSSHLFQKVSTHFIGPPPPYADTACAASPLTSRLEVMQPGNAWTAVVRGAVLRGAEGVELVLSRKSRRHYGLSHSADYDPDLHTTKYKFWDPLSEVMKVRKRYKWYIKRGDTVSSSKPISFPFSARIQEGQAKNITISFMVSDTDHAPAGADTLHAGDVRVLCTMFVNLHMVPARDWTSQVTNSGIRFSELDFEIGMKVESGGLRFDLRVDDVVYGQMMAAFD